MIPVVDQRIERYLAELHSERDPVLTEMERLAEELAFPIVGPQVGALLYILTRSSRAKRVLELGSGFGYSALFFANAVGPSGRVVLTDTDRENRSRAHRFLTKARLEDRIQFRVGDALELATSLRGRFDIVFNDIDKEQYPLVPDAAAKLLRPEGLLITDNALWGGCVAEDPNADEATRGVRRYNELMARDPRYTTVILPLRDGLSVSLLQSPNPKSVT